ncbi:hypothetical protein ACIQOU_18085 [Streptomyces sp. NPDC091279]
MDVRGPGRSADVVDVVRVLDVPRASDVVRAVDVVRVPTSCG